MDPGMDRQRAQGTMKVSNQLPALPAERRSAEKHRGEEQGEGLRPESAWATRIRRLLASKEEVPAYIPYMPVPKGGKLLKALRELTFRRSKGSE